MNIDMKLLEEFETTINTREPEKGGVPINILGFGEISLVFEIIDDTYPNLAYKRLPIFDDEEQVLRHINAYKEYNRLLCEDIGFNIPEFDAVWLPKTDGKGITLYCIQEKLPPNSIGNRLIHNVSNDQTKQLISIIMKEMKKVWSFNLKNEEISIGLDGQISNWSLMADNLDEPDITAASKLLYIDSSTPLYRIKEDDAMEPELFLKSAPGFLRGALRGMAKEVMDRYHDWRLVTTDLIGNFYKEQRPDLIPIIIDSMNEFFKTEAAEFNIEPFTMNEIKSYYKRDKFIWKLFQGFRKFDRFIKTKIQRKNYDFYLPGKIKR
ncbi:MAG: DUF6206 family protein [Candidatus Hodarchaeota archaeon]